LIDDGIGPNSTGSGRVKDNTRARARELEGDITWKGCTSGGMLSFPLSLA